jgi:hypothetical protein
MEATASIREIAAMSAVKALSRFETGLRLVEVKSDPSSQNLFRHEVITRC